jgi:hypothetical protein
LRLETYSITDVFVVGVVASGERSMRDRITRRRVLAASAAAIPLAGLLGARTDAALAQETDAVVGEVVEDDVLAMVVRDARTAGR